MRIGELGRAAGVDSETIRYYERVGLLPKPTRQVNGYRAYGANHVERLAFIRHCRALDIPLVEVRQLLELLDHPSADCRTVNRLIDAQLSRVQARLGSLQALERQLQRLRAQCDMVHDTTECGILQELVTAAQGEGCACHDASAGKPSSLTAAAKSATSPKSRRTG